MTDSEIIKALECCISGQPCKETKCPFYKKCCETDIYAVEKYALDLINRQKAEIDKLKIEICALSEKRITFPERLKIVKHARTETIKDFAKRLEKEVDFVDTTRKLKQTINNLVKEMTESEDEENGK